jgi:signal transduction histidine kinase
MITKWKRSIINSLLISSIFATAFLTQNFYLPKQYQIADNFVANLIIQIFLTGSFLLLLYIAGSYKIIHKYRNQVIESLNKYLKEKKYTDILSGNISKEEDSELAKYLHGEVQAGLAASSILLQKAAENNDSAMAHEALERAAGLLSQDHTNISYTRMASPETKLSKIAKSWKGIADIKIDFPDFSLIETVTLRNAVTLIEEAVSNSIRHANATNINISGLIKEDILTVNIISNGDIVSKGRSGLGTKLFKDLTIEWNLVNEGTHSRLTFYMHNRP